MNKQLIKWFSEIQAISQSGNAFCQSPYDKERYDRLIEIAAEMAAMIQEDTSFEKIKNLFVNEKGYATPKLDVRGFVLQKNKLLLVRERSDNLWTLPGGFAEVNQSPSESIEREIFEESGYQAKALRLLALWDKLKHDHPNQWPQMYKCFFHCEIISGAPKSNLEISEIDFFSIDNLPQLSLARVTKQQILRLYDAVIYAKETMFD